MIWNEILEQNQRYLHFATVSFSGLKADMKTNKPRRKKVSNSSNLKDPSTLENVTQFLKDLVDHEVEDVESGKIFIVVIPKNLF